MGKALRPINLNRNVHSRDYISMVTQETRGTCFHNSPGGFKVKVSLVITSDAFQTSSTTNNLNRTSVLISLPLDWTMGCNTSRDAVVVDPSKKPETRPASASSTSKATAEETKETTEKEKDETEGISSCDWPPSFLTQTPQSKISVILPVTLLCYLITQIWANTIICIMFWVTFFILSNGS